MMLYKETIYSIFKISHTLAVTHDSKKGVPVIFLHGIASDSSTWKNVIPIVPASYRSISIDLLGFGVSPKPTKKSYSTNDHAKAVIKTIKKLHLHSSVILVGHSMGGLIAVEVAKQRPDLVSNLILVSTPLYTTQDISKARKQSPLIVTNGLFSIYKRIITHEKLTLKTAQTIMKVSPSAMTFTLTKDTWIPFKNSLQNTIMHQSALFDIASIPMPVHFIYGTLDMLVIAKYYDSIANGNPYKITMQSYRGGHMINTKAAQKVTLTIQASSE